MLFNEIIDTQSIEEVASKTNISISNLGHLVEENFEKLNRVKALGFLLILEREYSDIDVSGLREKVKAYYAEHKLLDDKVVMVAKDSVESGFSFFKLFIILAFLGGGYYLYSEGKLDSLIQNFEDKKDFFDDKKALDNNVSIENADKVVVGKSDTESITIETPIAPKAKTVVLDDKTLDNKKEEAKEVASAQNILKAEDENKSVESVVKEVSKDFLANAQTTSLDNEKSEVPTEADTTVSMVNINPTRGMLWYGFINLDSKKRREFMKKVSTPFNISGSRWLLVTGHGYLDIVANDKTLEIADSKKHYFYIDSKEIREIDMQEFRDLNGHRGW